MNEDTLPQIPQDPNEETVIHDPQRTRPTDTLPKTSITSPRVDRVQKPTPTGQHVQPITGKHPANTGRTRRPPKKRHSAQNSSLYLPWWSLALMLLGVLVVSFSVVAGAFFLRNATGLFVEPTPIIQIITAVPTEAPQIVQPTHVPQSTEIITGNSAPAELQLQGPTLEAVQFTPTPVPIHINATVYVEGVDENKLNVRDIAGVTQSNVIFRAEEAEAFLIVDGPLQGDGFTWWKIQDPANPARSGWAVANYLSSTPPQ